MKDEIVLIQVESLKFEEHAFHPSAFILPPCFSSRLV
jgi:hypothetical protein